MNGRLQNNAHDIKMSTAQMQLQVIIHGNPYTTKLTGKPSVAGHWSPVRYTCSLHHRSDGQQQQERPEPPTVILLSKPAM